jgi:probable addiction module antidote protein
MTTKAGTKTTVKTRPYDSARYLTSEKTIAMYLEEAFETGDPVFIADALGVVARAHGMSDVAKATGLGRESLYKALSADGNPELATVLKVVTALGLRLSVERATKS